MEPPNPLSPSINDASHFFSQKHPLRRGDFQSCPSIFAFFVTISLLANTVMSRIQVNDFMPITPSSKIPYSNHCNHIVKEAPLERSTNITAAAFRSLGFSAGFFTGGEGLFDGNSTSPSGNPKSASFSVFSAHKATSDQNVFKIEARLALRIRRSSSISGDLTRRRLRMVQYRGPRVHTGFRFGQGILLTGFWSESTGKLCMVGSGSVSSSTGNSRSVDAVLKLNYSSNSSIYGSLVSGVLESVEDKSGSSYFAPAWILGVAKKKLNYEYTLLDEAKTNCGVNSESLALDGVKGGLCSLRLNQMFRLEYENQCGNGTCSPLTASAGYAPRFLSLRRIQCDEEEKIRFSLSFRNSRSMVDAFPFDPNTSLVAEGVWDEKKKSFCAVACKILNFTGSSSNAAVGDCLVKLSFRFPAVLSIRKRSAIVGQIWSDRSDNNPGYFSKIKFSSLGEPLWSLPGLRYEYTETDSLFCANKNNARNKGKDYPNGHSSDMELFMKLKNSKGIFTSGFAHASPLFVGDELYRNRYFLSQGANQPGVALHMNNDHKSFINISYQFKFPANFKFGSDDLVIRTAQISAEGTYDKDTGLLCMLGCQSVTQESVKPQKFNSLDCEIAINIQFSPLKSRNDNRLKGSIESTRNKSDPLYFGCLDLWSQSMSSTQAKESVWRMDLEIAMVLISSTLSCVFLGIQLYHVKKNQETVPFISIVMLVILALGYVVPLLLSFGALFKTNPNQRSVFFENDGWLEANKIIARVMTLVALIMEIRLLQLSWSTRRGNENKKSIWDSEKKVLYILLPLYITGGLIAWLVNQHRNSRPRLLLRPHHTRNLLYRPFYLHHPIRHRFLWSDLKSYGGLIHDGFLLPQILFNAFYDSKEKSLADAFYVGTTLMRLLPHVYDLYRGHSYPRSRNWSYIYANHKMDYYSTACNIIIPCGALLFAFLVFLQHRFGGQVILPKKFRGNLKYTKLPTGSSVELQGENIEFS